MERLTKKIKEHYIARQERLNGKIVGNQMCLDKLGEYENLEEKGLLVRLPCKVGDRLYIVGSKCLAGIVEDSTCEILDCDECKYDKELIVFDRLANNHMIFALCTGENENLIFGETVFLTREQAEQRLKEMESES